MEEGWQKALVMTLGCRLNQFESEQIQQSMVENGIQPVAEVGEAHWVVVNTCSVTVEADRQSRQLIRRLAREHPGLKIVATGCYAQRQGVSLAELPGVAMVLGNREKLAVGRFMQAGAVGLHVGEMDGPPPLQVPLDHPFQGQARSYLKVQEGCDERCTFCIIPQVRGQSRSHGPEDILAQARGLLAEGFRELVVTGINLGSYGRDLDPPLALADLLQALLRLPGLGRLMLSSMDPMDVDDRLLDLYAAHDRLTPYLHLSMQSGDDGVLKRMGRRHRQGDLLSLFARVREKVPHMVLGADVMVGFPGESREGFQASREMVLAGEVALLHLFRYSDRPGTAAARFPAAWRVAVAEARDRSEILRETAVRLLARIAHQWQGRQVRVLLEQVVDGQGVGRADGYLPMRLAVGEKGVPRALVWGRVDGFDVQAGILTGCLVEG